MAPDSRRISPASDDTQCPPTAPDADAPISNFEQVFDYSAGQVALVHGAAQEVACTASRRSGPRRWLRAVAWLIAAGLHGRANATTQRVADDLAARMDYTTGHVRYGLDEMAARLGMGRASVARHVAYLRELGALAWAQHGSRANRLRAMGLKGYAGTATVYAAVIPPSYDHAMGHQVIGAGYSARIVVDLRDRNPVDNPPVDNSSPQTLETPSLYLVEIEGQVQMGGGFNYTSQARPPKTRLPHQSSQINGRRRTAADVQKASSATRIVRALVNWTQSVGLRDLEFVLRPWTDQGWDAFRIVDELNGMCAGVRWRPRNPVAFIRARITDAARREQLLADQAASVPSHASKDWAQWVALENLFAEPAPARTREDRAYAQTYGWEQWSEVAAHYADDPDDAIDLYGVRICQHALTRSAREQEAYDRV